MPLRVPTSLKSSLGCTIELGNLFELILSAILGSSGGNSGSSNRSKSGSGKDSSRLGGIFGIRPTHFDDDDWVLMVKLLA